MRRTKAQKAKEAARQQALIETARRLYGSTEIEVDNQAMISDAEDNSGTWVQAWVWVPTEGEKCAACGHYDYMHPEGAGCRDYVDDGTTCPCDYYEEKGESDEQA